ncbi:MAG: hypothetical protein JW891_04760 [Candidatus Lokiarchaeota archaeon]|nr:hypothetical protein [Candidatus Lokiarchaeota archaeon]
MLIKNEIVRVTQVLCPECKRTFNVEITHEIIDNVDRYPFTIVLMHVSEQEAKREVHMLVVYIDQQLNCRHVTLLLGKRLFITPYILYNPNLLMLSCNKSLLKIKDKKDKNDS